MNLKHKVKQFFLYHIHFGSVETLCTRAVWLHQGRIKMDGDKTEVVKAYIEGTK